MGVVERRFSVVAAAVLASACGHRHGAPGLEKTEDANLAIPDVPVPKEDGPRLGALADITPVFDRPSKDGKELGYLHAGATVARSVEPYTTRGCDGGWFPIRPEGFVCASGSATTDLEHPTLIAMTTKPALDRPMPYTYARAAVDTTLYDIDREKEGVVRALGPLRAKSGLAVVGSWSAVDPEGKTLRLAMTTDGHFVPANDLRAANPSDFRGVVLGPGHELPLAFVVKRGVHAWTFRDGVPEKGTLIGYHERIDLTGHSRRTGGTEFWATEKDHWVRLEDVTLVRVRSDLPDVAREARRWLDVSVVTGTLVAYEGRTPKFATLVSVGRDRLGAEGSDAATVRGELRITGKEVTAAGHDPSAFLDGISIYDAPWVLKLSSGQLMAGAYWHDRFGIEHGPGNIELSPADAAWLFQWVGPELPEGWHGVTATPRGEPTIVEVRK